MTMLRSAVLLGVLCAVVGAVTSHGPAHAEVEPHAIHSQKMAQKMWKLHRKQQEHVEEILTLAKLPRQEHIDMAVGKWSRKESKHMRNHMLNLYRPSAAISLLEKTSFSKPIIPQENEQPKVMMDWEKWDKFALNEFEAARMTGELDAEAHRTRSIVPKPSIVLNENIQTSEGSTAPVDKMCGCEVALAPVCGADGETYPSKCFAECAGLAVSHSGPCVAKSKLEAAGSYKVMKDGKISTEDLLNEQFLIDVATPKQAGVDFPSMSTFDSRNPAQTIQDENIAPRDIKMPFSHVVTHRQFEDNLKELTRVAEQFEPALKDERLAKCECRGAYTPVCGADRTTYPSVCYASCVGVALLHAGPCRSDETHTVATDMDEVRDPLCFCSLIEKPVCGVDGVTYTNRCFADCVHMRVKADGPCITIRA
eukprot:c15929_g1_i1.p1 GENE.c15929_g1_i1~~c15929_g1_i1.p1  ORF type:complete len:423 (+),score=103.97 c15929_g1_i1:42-1310(+)